MKSTLQVGCFYSLDHTSVCVLTETRKLSGITAIYKLDQVVATRTLQVYQNTLGLRHHKPVYTVGGRSIQMEWNSEQ
jgi:hypothetical protein